MMSEVRRHDFATREELADALASVVAARLTDGIAAADAASLAVSGGSTPARFFEVLSGKDIDWSKVNITLVDERFVPENSPRSNAGLVKGKLLRGKAANANFLPLYQPGDLASAAGAAEQPLSVFFNPPDVVVLGMGNDGHTASFFPDALELEQLLDPKAEELAAVVHAPSAGEERLTLTSALIGRAGFLALHIEGAEKLATLDKALGVDSTLPIRRVIDTAQTPVEIFWAA
jgi:6-phosphogluconolactonase